MINHSTTITEAGYDVIFKLTSCVAIKVLLIFLQFTNKDNDLFLSTGRRKQIRELLDVSSSQLATALKLLKENGVLEGSDGSFKMNPDLFKVKETYK